MAYVDGFVLPVPRKNIAAYRKMATTAGKVWREHGALDYKECIADDLVAFGMDGKPAPSLFPKLARAKSGETVFFSYIVYKSKAHRNRVNKKVMSDPSLADHDKFEMPFDMRRMAYAGFKPLVEASANEGRGRSARRSGRPPARRGGQGTAISSSH